MQVDLTDEKEQHDFYALFLLALTVWREARGEQEETKQGVAWVIMNRAKQASWWGDTIQSVILKPYQFSSFNRNDPNATKFPSTLDTSWMQSLTVAQAVMEGRVPDPTNMAVFYFDKSLDSNPPSWSTDGSLVHAWDSGSLHFYRRP